MKFDDLWILSKDFPIEDDADLIMSFLLRSKQYFLTSSVSTLISYLKKNWIENFSDIMDV